MKFSKHARIRMGQRGIPDRLINLARKYGRIEGDEWVMDRKQARAVLEELDAERAVVMKVIDKGGIAVVEKDAIVITTYNITERRRND